MRIKSDHKIINLVIVVLFLLVTALNGFVPVVAAPDALPAGGLEGAVVSQTASSTTVTIPTSADTYISTNDQDKNYGSTDPIRVTRDSNSRSGLFKFPLTEIPSGATITEAKLVMNITSKDSMSKEGNQPLYLYNLRRN